MWKLSQHTAHKQNDNTTRPPLPRYSYPANFSKRGDLTTFPSPCFLRGTSF